MKKKEIIDGISEQYITFLREMHDSGMPIYELFEGKPSKKKQATFLKLIEFLSKTCREVAKINPRYDARDLNMDLISAMKEKELMFVSKGIFDEDKTNPVRKGKDIAKRMFDYLRQNCILENENHDLTINLVAFKSVNNPSMRKIVEQNVNKMAEAVITQDGTIYPAQDFHDTLIRFLIANNINLKGAVRIDTKDECLMCLSSLEQFDFIDEDFSKEKTILLSDEQALSIYTFFERAKSQVEKLSCSFEQCLEASENLGWQFIGGTRWDLSYYSNAKTKANLRTINEAIETIHNPEEKRHRDHFVCDRLKAEFFENNKFRRGLIVFNSKEDGNLEP